MTLVCIQEGWLSCRTLGMGLSCCTEGAPVVRLSCSLLARKPRWR